MTDRRHHHGLDAVDRTGPDIMGERSGQAEREKRLGKKIRKRRGADLHQLAPRGRLENESPPRAYSRNSEGFREEA